MEESVNVVVQNLAQDADYLIVWTIVVQTTIIRA